MFRNNSGMFMNDNGAPVYFGLGNTAEKRNGKKISDIRKSSDEIGYTKVLITPEMVGHELAIFTSIEYKAKGFIIKKVYNEKSREAKQLVWLDMTKKAGGIGGFASCPDDIDRIFDEWYKRFKT